MTEQITDFGIRSTAELPYDLLVIGRNVTDVVQSAGGWISDRVRTGWRVQVLVPDEYDDMPLKILGATPLPWSDGFAALGASTKALAVASSAVVEFDKVHDDVRRALADVDAEVTLWGEGAPVDVDQAVEPVRHVLSEYARAFKSRALFALSLPDRALPYEYFRSALVEYPANAITDLAPIG